MILYINIVIYTFVISISNVCSQSFPEDFQFGVATAAYQIEGAWNVDGKSESNWDYYTHTFPDTFANKSNGDVACLAYYKIDEDIENLKKLNVDFYRFSIAWTRILPTGFTNYINQPGVDYYNRLIDKLLINNIEPVVTIYHWDMPQALQELGGWTNPLMSKYLESYSRVLFRLFGDRVKKWITINEPTSICYGGYELKFMIPFLSSNIGNYLCVRHVLLAHAKVFQLYQKEFRAIQNGRIGISLQASWFEPNTTEDALAAENSLQFYVGLFAHPIFTKEGDYPKVVRKRVDFMSKKQGLEESKLPYLTNDEIDLIKGSADFFGLNHYTAYKVVTIKEPNYTAPNFSDDIGGYRMGDKNWETTASKFFYVVPRAIRNILNWIKLNYNNVEVLITENGYAAPMDEGLEDYKRINFNNKYLTEISKAIYEDGCNVTGYTSWSYLDNFEWRDGYTIKFGLYHVDFNDTNRPRTPKLSAYSYQNIIHTRKINDTIIPTDFLH